MKLLRVGVAAVLLAGCSSGSTSEQATTAAGVTASSAPATAAKMLGLGEEAAADTVPWSQVGPGWLLTTWSPVPAQEGIDALETATTTVYLMNPAGGRYPLTTFPPPGDAYTPQLTDWSGDGSHALFLDWGSSKIADHSTSLLVDLHTGAKTTVAVDGDTRFTRPDGKALLRTNSPGTEGPPRLDRYDLTGKHQLTYPVDKLPGTFNGNYLSTPDGTRLILDTDAGLVRMGNDGTIGATLAVPGFPDCNPTRWWDDATVLATCNVGSGTDKFSSQLWLVPVDGSAPTALTKPNDGSTGPDYSDMNAWKLPAGTFVQAAGGCGTLLLVKLNPDGTTTTLDVPHTEGSIKVIGVDGAHLVLQSHNGCERGVSLLDYDPATNISTVLLGPSVNGGGVLDTVAFADQK
jgi:TolB protein